MASFWYITSLFSDIFFPSLRALNSHELRNNGSLWLSLDFSIGFRMAVAGKSQLMTIINSFGFSLLGFAIAVDLAVLCQALSNGSAVFPRIVPA